MSDAPKIVQSPMMPNAALIGSKDGLHGSAQMRVNNFFWARHRKEMRGMKHSEPALLKSAFGIMVAR